MSDFEKELRKLMEKYGVRVTENTDYESGTYYYFEGDGVFVSMSDLTKAPPK